MVIRQWEGGREKIEEEGREGWREKEEGREKKEGIEKEEGREKKEGMEKEEGREKKEGREKEEGGGAGTTCTVDPKLLCNKQRLVSLGVSLFTGLDYMYWTELFASKNHFYAL